LIFNNLCACNVGGTIRLTGLLALQMQVDVNLRYALIRLANTGLYIVYNSRFDTLGMNPDENGGMPVTPTGER